MADRARDSVREGKRDRQIEREREIYTYIYIKILIKDVLKDAPPNKKKTDQEIDPIKHVSRGTYRSRCLSKDRLREILRDD